MTTYIFATDQDADRFPVEGATLQEAFESLVFRAEDYACDDDDVENLRGTPISVWAWDEDGERHDWRETIQ